jgi:predicted metal-binding protein
MLSQIGLEKFDFLRKVALDRASCVYPERARYSEEAVDVNVQATAKNIGIETKFPFDKNPASFALALID